MRIARTSAESRPCPPSFLESRALAAASLLALSAAAPRAHAAWTAIPLHPTQTGAARSGALGIDDALEGGTAFIGGRDHAGIWTGSASSWIDLHPAGAFDSIVYDVEDGAEVGYTTYSGGTIQRAGSWFGTAASWTMLHPSGADNSAAQGLGGGQQVGWVTIGGNANPRAALWSGTAASWIDLHPSGFATSLAHRTDGAQQVGYVLVAGVTHASVWSGSSGSRIDLHPAGTAWSDAFDVDAGQQGGFVHLSSPSADHAAVWTGSAGSWVDLNPAGALESRVHAVRAGRQVGYSDAGGFARRACIWSGTAGSAVDLHAFVPSEYSRSQAQGLFIDGATVMVVGSAYDINEGRNEAMLWIDSPPVSVAEPLRDAEVMIAPSPLRSYATLRYALAAPSMVMLDIYDVRGRRVDRLIHSAQSSGAHAVVWRGTDASGAKLPSGTYYYDFRAGERRERGKVAIAR